MKGMKEDLKRRPRDLERQQAYHSLFLAVQGFFDTTYRHPPSSGNTTIHAGTKAIRFLIVPMGSSNEPEDIHHIQRALPATIP